MSVANKNGESVIDHNPNFVVCAGIDEFYLGEGQNRLEVYVGLMDCNDKPKPRFNHNYNRHVTAKEEKKYFIDNWLKSKLGDNISMRLAFMFKNGKEIVVNGDSFEIATPRIIRSYLRSIEENPSAVILGFDGSVPPKNVMSIENGLSDIRASAVGFVKPKNLRGRIQRVPKYASGRRVLELVRGADVICGEIRREIESSGDIYKWLTDERMVGLWFGRKEIQTKQLKLEEITDEQHLTPKMLLDKCRGIIK